MKVWISKYALTKGIYDLEVEPFKDTGMVTHTTPQNYSISFHGEGRQWHHDKNDAILKASDMRMRKINSLQKQIKKLHKLKF